MKPLLAAGWLVHLAFWAFALARSGRAAAGTGEWVRELALRLTMCGLILAGIGLPGQQLLRLSPPLRSLALLTFLLGQGLAVASRLWLGDAWTVGVRPRAPVRAVRSGPYALVSHPIYAGTFLAIVAQLAILQNLPALLLVVAAVVVIPLKAAREGRWFARHAGAAEAASRAERSRTDR